MSYLSYVISAYTVFVVVLAADGLSGLLAVRRARAQGAPLRRRTDTGPAARSEELER